MRTRHLVFSLTIVLVGVVASLLWVQTTRALPGDSPAYRVTPWPEQSGQGRYAAEVEEHLNKLAAEGWRFHSDAVGQTARIMIFERAPK